MLPTNREELSLRTVMAFPKASRAGLALINLRSIGVCKFNGEEYNEVCGSHLNRYMPEEGYRDACIDKTTKTDTIFFIFSFS